LPTEAARLRTRAIFESTSLFVITLGLAEIWFQRREHSECGDDEPGVGPAQEGAPSNTTTRAEQVLWRAVPSDKFDPTRHGFRVSSVSENLANLRKLVQLIRAHVPAASIVFTLSPVPLSATFRGVSCVTANAVSKSVLRVAVDELLRSEGDAAGVSPSGSGGGVAGDGCAFNGGATSGGGVDAGGRLYYWPAYEMIKEAFSEPYLEDGRHVKPDIVRQVLNLFGKHYCRDLDQGLPDVAACDLGSSSCDAHGTHTAHGKS
jgi:hypothetical protein